MGDTCARTLDGIDKAFETIRRIKEAEAAKLTNDKMLGKYSGPRLEGK